MTGNIHILKIIDSFQKFSRDLDKIFLKILVIVYAKFPENFLFFVKFPQISLQFHDISTFSQSINQNFRRNL